MKYLRLFEKAVHKVSRFFSWVSAAFLFIMMALTTVDVIGRYIFNFPIIGTQDLVELALVICVFGAMGHVTIIRGHIRADMLNPVLSKRNMAIVSAFSFALSTIVAVPLAYETCTKAIENLKNLNIVTSTVSIPIGPFFAFGGFGLIILTMELLFDTIAYIKEAEDPDNPEFAKKAADDPDFTCL